MATRVVGLRQGAVSYKKVVLAAAFVLLCLVLLLYFIESVHGS